MIKIIEGPFIKYLLHENNTVPTYLRHAENAFYKVGRWAMIAVFKQYLWEGWTDLENRFDKNKRPHRGTHGRSSGDSIRFDDVRASSSQGTLLSSVWKTLGAKYRVCMLTPKQAFCYFLNFRWKRENLKRKWKKRFFLDEQKQANMAIFVAHPQVSLAISQASIIFFRLECLISNVSSLKQRTVNCMYSTYRYVQLD